MIITGCTLATRANLNLSRWLPSVSYGLESPFWFGLVQNNFGWIMTQICKSVRQVIKIIKLTISFKNYFRALMSKIIEKFAWISIWIKMFEHFRPMNRWFKFLLPSKAVKMVGFTSSAAAVDDDGFFRDLLVLRSSFRYLSLYGLMRLALWIIQMPPHVSK